MPVREWWLNGKPYEVQSIAGQRASGKPGYAWFLDPGIGKTATSLNEITEHVHQDLVDGAVVICPNSLRTNWKNEASEFGVTIPVYVWPDVPVKAPFIFVINYEAMLHSGYDAVFKLARKFRLSVYLDESQRIKNPDAATTKKLLGLKNEFAYRRLLSGTPMTQSVVDLYPQLLFVGAIHMKAIVFKNRYAIKGGHMGKQIVGMKNEDELRSIMDQYCFRATKDEWLDLPEKIYTSRHVDLSKPQLEAYRSMAEDFIVMLHDIVPVAIDADGDPIYSEVAANMVVTQLQKLQQISSGFIIDEEGKAIDLVSPDKNPRMNELAAIVEDTPGKLIVFCKHRHTAAMLLDRMGRYGCSRLVGGMKDDEISEEKARFNSKGGNRVCVAQLSVGGVGHTLLGAQGPDRCSNTVFYENDFSLEKRIQAEDRNHRHGQDRAVVYTDLKSTPIDTKVVDCLQRKLNLVRRLIDGVKEEGA